MTSTRRGISALLGLALTALASGCATPHPAEGLRPLPLLTLGDSLTRQAQSLRPLLQWEPFPRPADMKDDKSSSLSRVQIVTYEVRIWRAESPVAGLCAPFPPEFAADAIGRGPCIFPGELVYTRGGLANPFHTVESPLAPATVYLWAVRARFDLDGQPRVTQWSVLNATDRNRLLPEQRAETLPSLCHYPFRTPVEQSGASGLEPRNGTAGR
jgi:hypothetical protein